MKALVGERRRGAFPPCKSFNRKNCHINRIVLNTSTRKYCSNTGSTCVGSCQDGICWAVLSILCRGAFSICLLFWRGGFHFVSFNSARVCIFGWFILIAWRREDQGQGRTRSVGANSKRARQEGETTTMNVWLLLCVSMVGGRKKFCLFVGMIPKKTLYCLPRQGAMVLYG